MQDLNHRGDDVVHGPWEARARGQVVLDADDGDGVGLRKGGAELVVEGGVAEGEAAAVDVDVEREEGAIVVLFSGGAG